MLLTLHISNFALIDRIDLTLHPGLNIITGETGGGKSIMLDALSLLLGARQTSRRARHEDSKTVIEATFDVTGNAAVKSFCEHSDIDYDPERIILRREISPSGRSRSFVNDTPVTIDRLRDLGIMLVDIHSQHQNLLLSSPSFQLQIIDTLADNAERLEAYTGLFNSYRAALHKYKTTKAAIARDRENADFMQYQLEKIDVLNLEPGELDRLEADREHLSSAADSREDFDIALEALSSGETNAMSCVSEAAGAVMNLSDFLPEDSNIADRLNNLKIELSDIADTIREASSAVPADAASDLERIDNRISRIREAMARNGAENSDRLIEAADRLRRKIMRLDESDDILAELEKAARAARKRAADSAAVISDARRRAALEFAALLRDTAMPLGMKNLVCDIAVEPADMSITGSDKVDFRFAFNKNQTPVAVGDVASGGEISRLMLCIKSIIASRIALPSIIFDEVDTGVSGDVASRMGRMMRSIADNLQVIAITHLPQVAAQGQHHFKVSKYDTDTATHTHIEELEPERRIEEIALMLSGDSSNAAAVEAAKTLLNNQN